MNPESKLMTTANVAAWAKREREARGLTVTEAAEQMTLLIRDWDGENASPMTEAEWCDIESGEKDLFSEVTLLHHVTERLFKVELNKAIGFRVLSLNGNRALVSLLEGVPKSRLARTLDITADNAYRHIANIIRLAKAPQEPRQWAGVRSALLENLELADQCAAEVAAVQAKYSKQIQELDPDRLEMGAGGSKHDEPDFGPGR